MRAFKIILFLSICTFKLLGQSVKEVKQNVDPDLTEFIVVKDIAYFPANNTTHGVELWRSDGSESGTFMVKDIYTGTRYESSYPNSFRQFGEKFIFLARNDSNRKNKLFISDGTESGTFSFEQCYSPTNIILQSNKIFFVANETSNNKFLYSVNLNGVLTKYNVVVNQSNDFIIQNGELFYGQKDGIYKYDDVNNQFTLEVNYNNYYVNFRPESFYIATDLIYFFDLISLSGRTFQRLVVYNKQTKIFEEIKDFLPEYSNFDYSYSANGNAKIFKNKLIFAADDGTYGKEPWISDGLKSGTKMIKDLNVGGGNSVQTNRYLGTNYTFLNFGNHFLFGALNSNTNLIEMFDYDIINNTLKAVKTKDGRTISNFYGVNEENFQNTLVEFTVYKEEYLNGENLESTYSYNKFIIEKIGEDYEIKDLDFFVLPNDRVTLNNNNYYFTGGRYLLSYEYYYFTCDALIFYEFNLNKGKFSIKHFYPSELIDDQKIREGNLFVQNFIPLKSGVLMEFRDKSSLFYGGECDLQSSIEQEESFRFCKNSQVLVKSNSDESKVESSKWILEPYNGYCSVLGNEFNLNYSATEGGQIYVIQKSKNGCYSADFRNITVLDNSFKVNLTGQDLCNGKDAYLNVDIVGNSVGPLNYIWSFNGTVISNQKDNLFYVNSEGVYKLEITDSLGCSSKSSEIKISELAPSDIDIYTSDENPFLTGSTKRLSVISQPSFTYQWYFNDQLIPSANSSFYTATNFGTYKVQIENQGCTEFSNEYILELITSLKDELTTSVYPNPSHDIINFDLPLNEPVEIKVYNSLGQKVFSKKLDYLKFLNISELPNGSYFFLIDSINNKNDSEIGRFTKY